MPEKIQTKNESNEMCFQSLLRERIWVWTRGSANWCVMDQDESPFSREQWLCPMMLMTTWKVAIHGLFEIRIMECHTQTERRMHVVC
jgi:hypothetical protein